MPPFLGGGSMIRRVTLEGFEPAELPAKFEAGTPPIVPALGLAAAIDYLNGGGYGQHPRLRNAADHQSTRGHGGRGRRASSWGPIPHSKAGIVSFVVDGIHAHDVAQVFDRYGVAIRAGHHCAMPLHKRLGIAASNRASFYFYNTLEEVEKLGEVLHATKQLFRREGKKRRRGEAN